MSIWLSIILLIVTLIILITTGVFTIRAAIHTKEISGYGSNDALKSAHDYLTWASVVSIVGAFIVLVLIILYMMFGIETVGFTGSFASLGLLGLTMILIVIVGILAAIGASKLHGSSGSAYSEAIIASVLSLGGIGLIIGLFIYVFIAGRRERAKEAKIQKVNTQEVERQKAFLTGVLLEKAVKGQPLTTPGLSSTLASTSGVSGSTIASEGAVAPISGTTESSASSVAHVSSV